MTANNIHPCLYLLATLCKPEWKDKDWKLILDSKGKFDHQLIPLAKRHRVSPLLYSAHLQSDFFPEGIAQTLKISMHENQLKALRAKAMQMDLKQALEDKNVSCYFLKGTGLAERFYNDIGERHVLDLDLLIPSDKITVVAKVLESKAYLPEPDISDFNVAQWDYYRKTHHDLYFYHPLQEGFLPIEMHWHLRSPLGVFKLSSTGPLNTTDEFLYLCVHGTEHAWFRLKWLMDLPRIILKTDFDWIKVWQRAEQLQCSQHLLIAFQVMEELNITETPSAFKEIMMKNRNEYEKQYIFSAIGSESGYNDSDQHRWKFFRYLWRINAGQWNPYFLMNLLTTPNDWKAVPLPRSLFFLYFPLRPFIWLFRRLRK
jgi:hypothetical protein